MIDRATRTLVAASAVMAPALHGLSDAMEWWGGGYGEAPLVVNYAAFVLIPFMAIGLYAVQRPAISRLGLAGAVLYGSAFVYFAHTTLLALHETIPDYGGLLAELGAAYLGHGAVMVAGGALLAVATIRAGLLPRWTGLAFLAGLATNLLVALAPVPPVLQMAGSALRNAALIGMGVALLAGGKHAHSGARDDDRDTA